MTKEQNDLLKELFDNQSQFSALAGSKSPELARSYKELDLAFCNYALSVQQNAMAHIGQSKAYSAKKIDPYIAGGAAQGLAGPGAGIYTATQADERNKRIDDYRTQSRRYVSETTAALSGAEKTLIERIRSTDILLNSIPAIRTCRIELREQREKNYQEAKKLLKGKVGDLKKAIEIFSSLEDYKDSKQMVEKYTRVLIFSPAAAPIPFFVCLLIGAFLAFCMIINDSISSSVAKAIWFIIFFLAFGIAFWFTYRAITYGKENNH